MGRMLPNIPLTFAQFERELSSERIRDKFATSKLLRKTYPSLRSGWLESGRKAGSPAFAGTTAEN